MLIFKKNLTILFLGFEKSFFIFQNKNKYRDIMNNKQKNLFTNKIKTITKDTLPIFEKDK